MLTGGRPAMALAAGIAGDVYRRLGEQNYFASACRHAGDAGFKPDLLLALAPVGHASKPKRPAATG